jgi:menaquinol-cytochrome c reductase iron-sulfur subunit
MDDVQPVESPAAAGATRRNFFVGAIYAMGTAIAAGLGVPALIYLLFPPKARKDTEWVQIGEVTHLAPNTPVEMAFRKNRIDGWKVTSEKSTAWVVKDSANHIVAFGPQCTHLGCAYRFEETKGEFLCPCHNSLFALDGRVISGPAPRPLDRYETRIQGTRLLVGRLLKPGGPTA